MFLALVRSSNTLLPLTKIAPETVELEAFAQTVVGAIEALRDMKLVDSTHVVAHVVGASNVEAAVDWSPVCATGVTIVLVGPQAVPLTNGGGDCVSVVRALYTRAAVGTALGNDSPSLSPDVVSGILSFVTNPIANKSADYPTITRVHTPIDLSTTT